MDRLDQADPDTRMQIFIHLFQFLTSTTSFNTAVGTANVAAKSPSLMLKSRRFNLPYLLWDRMDPLLQEDPNDIN